ncbi:MAG TPA: hypothetical protein ENI11_04590 [Actinobacteria bacterium]|nr:hypothetical protein [Actinomycetota bacterium]
MDNQPTVSGQVYGGLSTIIKVLVFGFIILGVLFLARIMFLFFGSLKVVPGYDLVISFTEVFVSPLNSIEPVKTPYDGIFDIAATGALLIALVIEFVLSGMQGWLTKQQAKHSVPMSRPMERIPDPEILKTEDEIISK